MADSEVDIPAAKAELTAIIAAIDACPEEMRVPMLRMFLDRGLDQLEAIEDGFYAFLAECAMLAGQNMQDVRLQSLEAEVEKQKSPEGPTARELLAEVAILLAVELAVAGFVHIGVALILTAVGQRIATKAARTSLRAAEKEAVALESRLPALAARREYAIENLRKARARLTEVGGDPARSPLLMKFVVDSHTAAIKRAAAIDREAFLIRVALGASKNDARLAAAAIDRALVSPEAAHLTSEWRTFLHGALNETTANRIGESSGQAVAEGLTATRSAEAAPAFMSSQVIGMQLSGISSTRRTIAGEYADLRYYLRGLSDTQILKDERAQDLAVQIVVSVPELESRQAVADVARPAIVDGYELALWYQWLATSGMLFVDRDKSVGVRYQISPVAGTIHQGIVLAKQTDVTHAVSRNDLVQTTYVYTGDFYPGILRLSEFQAEYLFKKWAKRYFDLGFSTLPFPFDPAVYDNVYAQPARYFLGLVPDSERARRLDEMRLMVILFFIQFFERIGNRESHRVVSDATIRGGDWLAQIPHGVQRWNESLADEEGARERIDAPLEALFASAGPSPDLEIAEAESKLRFLMSSLELHIWMYELVYSQPSIEAADTPFDISDIDALRAIDVQKEMVAQQYAALKALVKDQPELLERLTAEFETWVATLTQWEADPMTLSDESPGNLERVSGPLLQRKSRWRWPQTEEEGITP